MNKSTNYDLFDIIAFYCFFFSGCRRLGGDCVTRISVHHKKATSNLPFAKGRSGIRQFIEKVFYRQCQKSEIAIDGLFSILCRYHKRQSLLQPFLPVFSLTKLWLSNAPFQSLGLPLTLASNSQDETLFLPFFPSQFLQYNFQNSTFSHILRHIMLKIFYIFS